MVMYNSVHMAKVTGNFANLAKYTMKKRQIKMQQNFHTPKLPN